MTQAIGTEGRRRVALRIGFMVIRLLLTITLFLVVYYQMPIRDENFWADLPWLLFDLVLFGVIVGLQIPLIIRARHPLMRSIEAMTVTICMYLVMFARIYLSLSVNNVHAFTQLLDHSSSLYFTVTVFATVGFGDIAAAANPIRLLVTVQMLLNLVVLGVVVRLLLTIGQRGRERKGNLLPGDAVPSSPPSDLP